MEKAIRLVEHHYKNIIFGSGLLGVNVGIYSSLTDPNRVPNKMHQDYLMGAVVGAIGGITLGVFAPFILPCVIGGLPGYIAFRLHSSQRGSQQKVGTQVDPKDLECQKKGATHG